MTSQPSLSIDDISEGKWTIWRGPQREVIPMKLNLIHQAGLYIWLKTYSSPPDMQKKYFQNAANYFHYYLMVFNCSYQLPMVILYPLEINKHLIGNQSFHGNLVFVSQCDCIYSSEISLFVNHIRFHMSCRRNS